MIFLTGSLSSSLKKKKKKNQNQHQTVSIYSIEASRTSYAMISAAKRIRVTTTYRPSQQACHFYSFLKPVYLGCILNFLCINDIESVHYLSHSIYTELKDANCKAAFKTVARREFAKSSLLTNYLLSNVTCLADLVRKLREIDIEEAAKNLEIGREDIKSSQININEIYPRFGGKFTDALLKKVCFIFNFFFARDIFVLFKSVFYMGWKRILCDCVKTVLIETYQICSILYICCVFICYISVFVFTLEFSGKFCNKQYNPCTDYWKF